MVYNNIRDLFFSYAIVLICLSYTYAPWTNQPETPPSGTIGHCYYWLFYHGFTDDNVENKRLASIRDTRYDQDVSYFAAAFAYLLSNSYEIYNINNFGPSEFCALHTMNIVNYPFMALKDAEFTCEGWIDLYLYVPDRDASRDTSLYDQFYTFYWALNRDESMDTKISLWAALYFQHITSGPLNVNKTPREFCKCMGKPIMKVPLPKKFSFMTLDESKMSCQERDDVRKLTVLEENVLAEKKSKNVTKFPFIAIGTKMSCYEWIKQGGFSDNSSINYQMVMSECVHENNVNYFAKEYITYVKNRNNNHDKIVRPLKFKYQIQCLEHSHEDFQYGALDRLREKIESHGDIVNLLMTPEVFCLSKLWTARKLFNYYGHN